METKLIKMFEKPQIIGLVGDVNTTKSNILYYFIQQLKEDYSFNLYSYGLRSDLGETKIFSLEELEQIKDSVIIIDEVSNLFDLEDRRKRRSVERTFRLINHNNNVLILSGLPENYKKFICGRLGTFLFTKCTISDFINGSKFKEICLNYKGNELGSSVLNIQKGSMLMFDGKHYNSFEIPYLPVFDSKKNNIDILQEKEK